LNASSQIKRKPFIQSARCKTREAEGVRCSSLELGGLRGLQDEAELLTKLLGQGGGQGLVPVPHGRCCSLLEHRQSNTLVTRYSLGLIPTHLYSLWIWLIMETLILTCCIWSMYFLVFRLEGKVKIIFRKACTGLISKTWTLFSLFSLFLWRGDVLPQDSLLRYRLYKIWTHRRRRKRRRRSRGCVPVTKNYLSLPSTREKRSGVHQGKFRCFFLPCCIRTLKVRSHQKQNYFSRRPKRVSLLARPFAVFTP